MGSSSSLPDSQYVEVQEGLELVFSYVRGMPLEAFVERAERSLEVGAFVDPVLHQEATNKLSLLARCARDLLRVQERLEEAAREGIIK